MDRKQIEENLRLSDEETKKRLSNPFYRIRFEIYQLKKRIKNGSSRIS
jgi:hypothetical protein